MVTEDRRYGCSRCDNSDLPGHGYLDRLKKGATPHKQQSSLQQHVETYHPEIANWMSLKVDLGKVPRPGSRKRKAVQIPADSYDDDNDDNDDQDGSKDEDEVVDDDETESDSDNTRAKKRARRRSASTRSVTAGALRDRPVTSVIVASSSITAPMSISVPTAMVPIIPVIAGPPRAGSVPVTQAPAQVAPVTDLREQNIQLGTSNQDYRTVNESLRQQVSGLLGALTNVVDEELHNFPFSPLAIQNALMHWTRADGHLVEQILGRVTIELFARRQPPPSAPIPTPAAARTTTTSQSQPVTLETNRRAISSQNIASFDSVPLSDPPSSFED